MHTEKEIPEVTENLKINFVKNHNDYNKFLYGDGVSERV